MLFRPHYLMMALLASVVTLAGAQPLLPEERANALRLESEAVQQKRLNAGSRTTSATATPDQIVGVRLLSLSEAPAPRRVAQLVRYQYDGAVTYHTYVDLATNQVLSVTPLQNFPTPLSDEEVARAAQLAREQVPEVASLLDAQTGQTTATIHGVQNSDPGSAEYSNRMVLVRHRSGGGGLLEIPPVTVNLTTGKARIQ